eukprot:s753_g7.t1
MPQELPKTRRPTIFCHPSGADHEGSRLGFTTFHVPLSWTAWLRFASEPACKSVKVKSKLTSSVAAELTLLHVPMMCWHSFRFKLTRSCDLLIDEATALRTTVGIPLCRVRP